MEYYSALKMNEVLNHATTETSFEDDVQTQKATYCMSLFI